MPFEYDSGILECCGLSGIYRLTKDNIAALAKAAERSFVLPGTCAGDVCCGECADEPCCGDCEDRGYGPGICIATTNEGQDREGVADELKKYKFVPVLNTLNPNSRNRITLWVRDLSEGKVSTELTAIPTPAAGNIVTELLHAVREYVERNPNPRTQAAQNLVEAYKKFIPQPE